VLYSDYFSLIGGHVTHHISWRISLLQPENFGFDLYRKDFSWKENGPNSPDFEGKKNSKSLGFYYKFQ
jgi:hypothetical protein